MFFLRYRFLTVVLVFNVLFSCKIANVTSLKTSVLKKLDLTEEELKTWHHKDIIEDTIPGISLDKAYRELIKGRQGEEIIVAVIDTKLDIFHEDIKDQLWINEDEIPDNNIDDDKNGYVDDIQGWNFLGNSRGEDVVYSNYECTRIIRKYKPLFKGKKEGEIIKDTINYKNYVLAIAEYEKKYKEAVFKLNRAKELLENYNKSKEALKEYFPNGNYTQEKLNKIDTVGNDLAPHVKEMSIVLKYNETDEWRLNQIKSQERALDYSLNFDYNERDLIGDNPNDITDTNYGNNILYNDSVLFQHAIIVTGVIVASRENGIGAKGIYDKAKIMAVCVAPSGGDEHDKDIALAIRYAVDNGAKIINMSFGKPFSLNKKWVDEAIKYASSNDVLIVCSAGNENREVTYKENHYPSDQMYDESEVSDNFIIVGGTFYTLDKRFKYRSTNYSKTYVDIFAPGQEVYSTVYNNKYKSGSGTSYSAPIVSGVAALIRSYYPKLTASQVKEIIMKSGLSIDIDVEMKQEDGTKKLVPFSELSKSGKIVNAYNALLMAEEVSKNKK